ncbi:MAG: hypothetical protein AAB345_03150 [Patescibacteria group bacterium]
MRKFALLFLVTASSFGSVGCINFGNRWNLPDPDQATIVAIWSAVEPQKAESYVVVLEQRERFAKVAVDEATFKAIHEGDKVEVELVSVTFTEDDKYIRETEYCWKIGDCKYKIVFRWDATKRPVRPNSDFDKS